MPKRADSLVEPQQARSHASLESILDAAEHVLRTKDFREATLAEIAGLAGYTIGVIYARFPGKQGIRDALERSVCDSISQLTSQRAVPDAWGDESIESIVRALINDVVGLFRRHRGALRALIVEARTDAALRMRLDRMNAETLNRFTAAVVSRRKSLLHPDPAAAAAFSAFLISAALREAILFNGPSPERSDAALAEELTRVVTAYLGPQ
jgi:AcrR family transcriptional regulator